MSGPRGFATRLLARVLLVTRLVDVGHSLFDRARARVVLRFASDQVLAEFNALAYQRDRTYVPGTRQFRHTLFVWEAATIRQHFPPPPARLLIGGAGGGREALALVDQGYDVVAFEPAADLAAGMAATAAETSGLAAFRGRYETLPALEPARPGDPGATLTTDTPFDAAVMGWGSFSHLMTDDSRFRALRWMADLVDGPVLVSFLAFGDSESDQPRRVRRHGDAFSVHIGFYHRTGRAELAQLAERAGLQIVTVESDETEALWPHAVLRRSVEGG